MSDDFSKIDLATGVAANLLVLGTVAYAATLAHCGADFYYLSVQEDEYLEWSTFWAFLTAAGVSGACVVRQLRGTRSLPWFLLGLCLFCFVVAMEEISWAQRVIGYRPPIYFLEENFQQELNVHNVFSTKARKLAIKGLILGYGVVLPLGALFPLVRRLLSRVAVAVPTPVLIPAFLAAYVTYEWYPWKFSGEWVELMLGLCFVFTVISHARESFSATASSWGLARRLVVLLVPWSVIFGLGIFSAAVSRSQRPANPEISKSARVEIESLKNDLLAGAFFRKCGLHKRLYTYMEKYGQSYLLEGDYSRLTTQGMPEARAQFFLDPWNLPYWIRVWCGKDRRKVFVYSFGSNRRRDSTRWEIIGDDVGAVLVEEEFGP